VLEPTNAKQYQAYARDMIPDPDRVRDGIWSIPMAMPNPHLPYNLCYLVEDAVGRLHVIDPGWHTDENWSRLQRQLGTIGRQVGDIATIVATHLHPDHLGMAERIRSACDAGLVLLKREDEAARALAAASSATAATTDQMDEWGVPEFRRAEVASVGRRREAPRFPEADIRLDDGQYLPIVGREFQVIHTPGHTPGHMCIRSGEDGLIITGDHVLPTIHAGLGLGGTTSTNPIADYLAALDRVAEFDGDEIAPGHEFRFRGLAARCQSTAEHHVRRTREVADALADDAGASTWEIASRLTWTAGWENLTDFYLLSALTQTQMHATFVLSGAAEQYLQPAA